MKRCTRSPLVVVLLAMLASLLLWCGHALPVRAADKTVFLPLKIVAADPRQTAGRVDEVLGQELAEQGITLLARSQAARYVHYDDGPWPPPLEALRRLGEAMGADYVCVGSYTELGDTVSIDLATYDLLAGATPHTGYRQLRKGDGLAAALAPLVGDVLAYTNRNFLVASVTPEGNSRVDAGAILRKIKTKPGDFYDPARLREDLKAVFAMGYFDDVSIEAEDTPKGKRIVIHVKEKPVIRQVVFSGAEKIKEEELRDAAGVQANTILNPSTLKDAVRKLQALYKSKGYYHAQVSTSVSYPDPDSAEVRFVIREGRRIYVRKIGFTGNSHFDDGDLEDVIKTSTRGWLSWLTDSGVLSMEEIRQDAARLAAFYHNHGFIEAKVGEPVVEQEGDGLSVTFPIEEGPRYRVGMVDIQGDLIDDKAKLLAMLRIREEEFLNRKVLREDILRLTDRYAEHGYAFAEITPKVEKAPSGQRVDIVLQVDQGTLVTFNRVEIHGNTRTRDNVIRRELVIREGGTFDAKAIRRSTTNLQRLGFFDEVQITPKPTLSEDQMDVIVEVKERPTGQFSIGAGYSSTDYLLFMAEISENNFMGTGNRLAFSTNLSGTTTRYNINFTNPRIFDSEVMAGFDLFNWRREYDDYTRDSIGGGVRFGHPLFEKWRISYGYTYSDTELSDIAEDASWVIRESAKIKVTSAVRVGLVRDTRNHFYAPSKGSRNTLSVVYAGGPLGGDAQFTRLEGATSWYFPLPYESVFHFKAAAGQAFENEDGKLPVYQRFYLGGLNSIRGFKSAHISPIDPETGDRVGGDKMWYSNVEIIFPLVKEAGLRGVIFADFGNVYAVEEDWDFGKIKKSAGVGLRWLSPMGPLRLEWGYNLDREEGERSSVWDFSVGGTF